MNESKQRLPASISAARIPQLAEEEVEAWLSQASESPRRRVPKILHSPGAEFNEVLNFVMQDSYMQPHLHPGDEKIEKIHLLRGKLAVLFFDDQGSMRRVTVLEEGHDVYIEVPAFTWHTYVVLSGSTVSYETMMGQYEPASWKHFAQWAPPEASAESAAYLRFLKGEVRARSAADVT